MAGVACAAGVALAACGSSSSVSQDGTSHANSTGSQAQPVRIALNIRAPKDATRSSRHTVVFKGTATRGANVAVTLADGTERDITAQNGTWHIRVPLVNGDNAFQVAATSPDPRYVESDMHYITVKRVKTRAEIAAEKAAAARRVAAAKAAAARRAANAKQNFISHAQTIPYAELIKDTTPFEGKKIALHGQIFQIQQQEGMGGIMLLSVTDDGYGLWTDNVWIDYDKDIPYVEKNLVTVYGTVTGMKSYDTQIGGTASVPEVQAAYVEQG